MPKPYLKLAKKTSPIGYIDVGAAGGVANSWSALRRYTKIVAFEPDKKGYEDLIKDNSTGNIYLNSAVSSEKGIKELLIRKSWGNTSFYENNDEVIAQHPYNDRFEVIDKVMIQTDTIDDQLAKNGIYNMDFLKVDVEGAELDVLKGAQSVLKNQIFAVEVETRFIEFYKNAPLFPEVYSFLLSHGFELYDLNRYFYKKKPYVGYLKGQLGMADALFFKRADVFIALCKRNYSGDEVKEKVKKAIVIASLYGYIGYAVELLENAEDMFSSIDYSEIMTGLKKCKPLAEKIPNFKGKGRIYSVLNSLSTLLRSSSQGAFYADNKIGN